MITGKENACIKNKNRSYLPKATPARLTNYRMKKVLSNLPYNSYY